MAKADEQARGGGERPPLDDGAGGNAPPIPAWLPWALYGLVTLVLFRAFVVSDEMLLGTDTLSLGYMAREFFAGALERGTFPRWNPLILGGTPFLESLAGGDSLYPPSVALLVLLETYRALGWKLILHVFGAGLFTYGWIRSLGRSRAAALLAGLAFLMAPFMVSLVYPGHDGKLFVTALTPLLFWATEAAFRGRSLLRWTGVAAVVGLVILTTHFQMAYFLFGAVGLYAFFRTAQIAAGRGPEARGGEGREEAAGARPARGPAPAGRKLGLFLAASLLGACLAAVQLVPAVEYVTESSRRTATTVQADEAGSVAYSSSWSLHPEEVASLVVPEFVGNDAGGAEWTSNTYWGRNPFKLNHEYAGLVVLLLAGLAFAGGARRDLRWFLAGLGGLGLLYSLGTHTPVWRIFYEVVPGVSLFRAPSMAIFLFGFAAVTLAAFGVDRALELARREDGGGWTGASRFLWGATAFLGLLTVLASTGVLTSAWTALLYGDMAGAKARALETARPFLVRGCFVATLLAGATALAWWAYRKGWLEPAGVVAVVGVLLFLDGVRVNDAFIQTFDFHRWAAPTANIRYLQERQAEEPPFRVFSMVQGGQDVKPGIYGLELAAGHHPNDLARYRELIGMEGSGTPDNLLRSEQVLRVLNVRYLLWPDAQYGTLQGMETVSRIDGRGGQPLRSVYRVPGLPRARLVGRARIVAGVAAVDTIMSPGFDVEEEVVLPEEPPLELGGGPVDGEVRWVDREINRLALEVRNESPALLVVADNWYPAWRARVDGADAPILRANHTLRAVALEPGRHRVEMVYESPLLERSLWLSLATLVLLCGVAGTSWIRRRRRDRA